MAADLSHLLSVDSKKHKYEKTVNDGLVRDIRTPPITTCMHRGSRASIDDYGCLIWIASYN